MATPLDLQDQEQVDALRAFWKQYGNLITWVLVLVLGAFAAWNGWQMYQRKQAEQAGAIYDELDRAAQAGDADKAGRVFSDLRERHPRTAFAQQGALVAARVQAGKGQADAARATLTWAVDKAADEEARTVARLRLAGMLLDAGKQQEALAVLDAARASGFEALVADRRADVLLSMGRKDEAMAAYRSAFKEMPPAVEYRRLVEAKMVALGASAPASGAVK